MKSTLYLPQEKKNVRDKRYTRSVTWGQTAEQSFIEMLVCEDWCPAAKRFRCWHYAPPLKFMPVNIFSWDGNSLKAIVIMYILLAAVSLSFNTSFHAYAWRQVSIHNGQKALGNMQYIFDILISYPLLSPSHPCPILHSVQKNGISMILYRSARSEEQWKENIAKNLPLCLLTHPATCTFCSEIFVSLSKVPSYISTSIKSQSTCAQVSSSFLFSAKLDQWISPRCTQILFPNWVYVIINTWIIMRRAIFQSFKRLARAP